ncbi:MAG: HlyD family type I secretion periplasmic adaptor subunit, partial [Acetobacteraceae bacterium]|nr:HlyD family type I secretion periplasmic adaptor subunit [Acetobacteraceae bacterium]
APRTRGPVLFGSIIFLVFIVGFGAWSALAPLAEAAIAPGVIKVEGTRRTIQHLEGGIVREILVRDGTRVKAGDVLVRLDDIQADATMEATRAQRTTLLAQDARLTAEREMAERIAFPDVLTANPDQRAQDAMTLHRTLFEARRTSLNSQVEVLRARIDQQRAVISSNEGQLIAARRQLELIRQEEQVTRGLMTQGLARLPQVLALQRGIAQVEGTIQAELGEIDRARHAITEAEKQIRQVIDQRMQEISTEQNEVRAKLADAEEKMRAAQDVRARREIVAPEDGTVINLKIFTIGGVIRPGEALMELVPVQDRLVAEVNVQPHDIDVVYPDLQAEVRLPAFKQRLVPYLHGHVTWVAADVTTNEQTRQQYYRAYILIDREQLERLPNVFLTPGMPVEAHIQIGQRSFFRYMTQPIRDSFHRAFREQ